jgi:hypothetical protein
MGTLVFIHGHQRVCARARRKAMGYIDVDEIRGYRTDDGILCAECGKDYKPKKQDEILTDTEIDGAGMADGFWFCDQCGEEL